MNLKLNFNSIENTDRAGLLLSLSLNNELSFILKTFVGFLGKPVPPPEGSRAEAT